MSQLNAEFVKQGFWVNLSKGPVMGQTITTTTSTGNLIVALVAISTTLGTSHLWNLFVFVYHQLRASSHHTDGLQRQQQALLRTLPPPSTLLTDWIKLWWVWKKRVDRALLRSLFLVIVAVIFAAIMVVVGIFSSYLVDSARITILTQSPYCSSIDYEGAQTVTDNTSYTSWATWSTAYGDAISQMAAPYVRECYLNRTALPERCRVFTQSKIPLLQMRTACPFEETMCQNISQPGFISDTGLLDFSRHFGLNLAATDSIKFRRTATCAVLNLEGHYDTIDSSNTSKADAQRLLGRDFYETERMRRYYLGKTHMGDFTIVAAFMPLNTQRYATVQPDSYFQTPIWSKLGSSFVPSPQMQSNDSDLVITFVNLRGTRFLDPVDDILYSAHRISTQLMTDNNTHVSYTSDEPLSAFACQRRYQFCFAQKNKEDKCTSLEGLPTPDVSSGSLGANEAQIALYKLVVRLLFSSEITGGSTEHLKPASFSNEYNIRLPNDQWLRDMVTMEQMIRAQLQIALTTNAIGISTLDLNATTPNKINVTQAEKNLCAMQLMQSPGGFVNINVFALTFVITFCVVVTALDLILLKFLVFWHRFRGLLTPRIDAWIQDGTLQLQRRAYEMHGEGTWERLHKEVPITTEGVELSDLPLSSKLQVPISQPPSTAATLTSEPEGPARNWHDPASKEYHWTND